MTAAGTVSEFDVTGYNADLAAVLNVSPTEISTKVEALDQSLRLRALQVQVLQAQTGSVIVSSIVHTASQTEATAITTSINELDAASASSLLHVNVEAISPAEITEWDPSDEPAPSSPNVDASNPVEAPGDEKSSSGGIIAVAVVVPLLILLVIGLFMHPSTKESARAYAADAADRIWSCCGAREVEPGQSFRYSMRVEKFSNSKGALITQSL